MTRIALVCESEYDSLAIEEFTTRLLLEKGKRYSFHCVQPNVDASSRPRGGWTRVLGWIRRNKGPGLQGLFQVPAFGDEQVFDNLIVHIDGDVLVHLRENCGFDLDCEDNVEEIINLLSRELDIPVEFRTKVIFAIPIKSTEAWILAGLIEEVIVFEEIDAKSEYRRRFEIGKAGDRWSNYKAAVEQSAERLPDIIVRSQSFARYATVEIPKLQ